MFKILCKAMAFILVILVFSGCFLFDNNGNNDPHPLIGPASITATSGDEVQTFQLRCSENSEGAYLYDVDGDTVTVEVDEDTPLPANITLDTSTGLLTVTRSSAFSGVVNFWTVDDQGSSEDEALSVAFTVTEAGSANQAPSVSFAAENKFVVSGADDTPAVNGDYTDSAEKTFSTFVIYDGPSGYELYVCGYLASGNWVIDDGRGAQTSPSTADLNTMTYYNTDNTPPSHPPSSSWTNSTPDAVTVTGVPFNGVIQSVGQTITASYTFSDPDAGDSEGASTYKWFRCSSPGDGGTEILIGGNSVNSKSYTTTVDDQGMYLKIEVTPKDNHGLAGTPVLSIASMEVGTS